MPKESNVEKFPGGDGKMPTAEQFQKAEQRFQNIKGEISELSGDLGSLMKELEKEQNLHRKAFKLVQQCKRMDDVKRSAFLAHFDHYRDLANLDSQLDLPLDDVAAAAAE